MKIGTIAALAALAGQFGCAQPALDSSAQALADDDSGWFEDIDVLPVDHSMWRGRERVRWQQYYDGVPVVGAAAIVETDASGSRELVSSTVRRDVRVSVTPSIAQTDAIAAAGLAVEPGDHRVGPVELAIVPDALGGTLVYRVPLFSPFPIRSWMVEVDAQTGKAIDVFDRRRFAQGLAYPRSPADTELETVELTGLPEDAQVLDGSYAVVKSVVFTDGELTDDHLAIADENGDFLYQPEDPDAIDPFSEVHSYYHMEQLGAYFAEKHNHTFDTQVQVTVNYREEDGGSYDNAFFTQDQDGNNLLIFGQGFVDFAYDSDVIAHEHGHSIIQSVAQLDDRTSDEYGDNFAPGAIHEGIADYWAATYQGDSTVGEYTVGRELYNARACPKSLSGEPHADGEILGATGWDVYSLVGPELSDEIIYAALGRISPSPTFKELGEAITEVSRDLAADGAMDDVMADEIAGAVSSRGLPSCGRYLDLSDGVAFDWLLWVRQQADELSLDQCQRFRDLERVSLLPFQFAITAPPADQGALEGVSFAIDMIRTDGAPLRPEDLDYKVYVRKGEMVTLEYEETEGMGGWTRRTPRANEFDIERTGSPSTIELGEGDIDLEPGATYYATILHNNCASVRMSITPSLRMGPVPDPDPDDDFVDDGGCSASGGGASGTALLVLLALVAVRRRDRR